MKVKFFTLVTILVIVVLGFIVYINMHQVSIEADADVPADHISGQPTEAPAPSVTKAPVQTADDLYPAFQIINGAKVYGYINSTGEFAIKPSFDTAGDFHNGLAVVCMNDQYLAVDTKGSILCSNDSPIQDFQNGMAVFSKYSDNYLLYGYIDSRGKETIQPQYRLAGNFSKDNTAYVYSGSGKYALIDKNGKILEHYDLDKNFIPTFIQDGYVIYYKKDSADYGVINMKGEEIFKPEYCEITYLGSNLFALKKSDDEVFGMTSAIPAALFKGSGEQLTDYILYDIKGFNNGAASVTDSDSTYFIGTDGKVLTGLPQLEGRGTAELFGEVIKAEVDGKLTYYRKDQSVIWKEETDHVLTAGITAKEIKFKPNKYAYVYYPQLEGLNDTSVQTRINTELKSIFTDSRKELKEKDMLSVSDSFRASLMKNLLVIEKDGYDYPFGAAHGMPIKEFYYIDTTNGTFYTFKDLFLADSGYVQKINEFITAEINDQSKKENAMFFPDTFKGISESPYFMLSENALTIYFTPYEIAAYAAGFPEFKIPFEDIYDYIDFNGAFWNAFR